MNLETRWLGQDLWDCICPDLTVYWQLGKVRNAEQVILQLREGNQCFRFSAAQGIALQHFTGHFTIGQVQDLCRQQLGETLSPHFVVELLLKLVELKILALPEDRPHEQPNPSFKQKSPSVGLVLKSCVQWIHHPDGYWILRNPKDVTFLQVSVRDKVVIDRLGQLPPAVVASESGLSSESVRYLLQLLTATGMLEGTRPTKPSKGKFNPLQLLFFKVPLLNPDLWLSRHVDKLRFLWSGLGACVLGFFLAIWAVIGMSQSQEIFQEGQQLWAQAGATLILPFILLMMLVVSMHELGHAFTLKHYGGIVPEIGLMFMCLMPGCYTNTTDSYCLVKRRQRALVVGAGVLVQLMIWAIALSLWNLSNPNTWLHTTSYLLMVAALFTVALNLNPLSKFDGYYLAVALSGINNLRSRSFQFYADLLQLKLGRERLGDAVILAIYAPFSFAYILLVFGHLLLWITDWSLSNIPMTALTLLLLWVLYFNWSFGGSRE